MNNIATPPKSGHPLDTSIIHNLGEIYKEDCEDAGIKHDRPW